MNLLLIISAGGVLLLLGIFFRERSWSAALLQTQHQVQEKEAQFENALQLLNIEKANNQYTTYVTFQFAERCLQTPLLHSNETENLSMEEAICLYQKKLLECHEKLIHETPLTNLNDININSTEASNAESSIKLAALSSGKLFDRTGWSILFVILGLVLSETLLLYRLSSSKSFKINGKTYEQSDFLEKPLAHALESFLIKEHPFTSFLLSSILYTALILLYLLSFVVSWTNAYYYQLFYRLIQLLIVYGLTNILSFLVFNSLSVFQFLKIMYSSIPFYKVIAENYRKKEFWSVILMKLFRVYDFYDLLLRVLWFGAHLLFLLPFSFLFYYYDSLYLHSDINSSQALNQSNHFFLISFLHLFFPFVCCYYLIVVTVLLPFLPPSKTTTTTTSDRDSTTFLYEPLIFSTNKSLLRVLFDYLMKMKVFYFDRGEDTLPSEQKTLKSQDMRIGLLFFLNAGNSVLYLLRFLYTVFFRKLTMTWLAYFNNWSFLAFHIFILLYTLPVINILLYKYEIMRKYRNVFHQEIIKKFEALATDTSIDLLDSEVMKEEIEVGLNLFDFALHKAVLYCLFIHRDENQEGEGSDKEKKDKNDVSVKLERIFTSFLQSDAFSFGVKFSRPAEEDSGDNESDNDDGNERGKEENVGDQKEDGKVGNEKEVEID